MKDALAANDFFDEQETLTPAQRDQRYHDHIDRELTGCDALMNKAMRRLDEDIQRAGRGADPLGRYGLQRRQLPR